MSTHQATRASTRRRSRRRTNPPPATRAAPTSGAPSRVELVLERIDGQEIESLLSVAEVALVLAVSVATVRRMIERRDLAAVRLAGRGGSIRIRPGALRAFLAAHERSVA
jgi:excisionase family DNA binding protein